MPKRTEPEQSAIEDYRVKLSKLSPRELAVARLRAKGHTIDGVAQEMGICRSTATNHATSAIKKLGVTSILEVCYELGRIDERDHLLAQADIFRIPQHA